MVTFDHLLICYLFESAGRVESPDITSSKYSAGFKLYTRVQQMHYLLKLQTCLQYAISMGIFTPYNLL